MKGAERRGGDSKLPVSQELKKRKKLFAMSSDKRRGE